MSELIQTEQALLGIMIDDGNIARNVLDSNGFELFTIERHKIIAEGICEALNDGCVDLIILTDILKQSGKLDKVGGEKYLSKCFGLVSSNSHWRWYLNRLLKYKYKKEQLAESLKFKDNIG